MCVLKDAKVCNIVGAALQFTPTLSVMCHQMYKQKGWDFYNDTASMIL